MDADIALLVLRIGLALLLLGHATQKLFGWFRGRGVRGTAELFAASGLRPAPLMVVAAALTEAGSALLLALGLAVPLAVAMAVGAMIVAAVSLRHKGLWAHLGGYEVPLAYAGAAAVVGIAGAGRFSLDALLPWAGAHGLLWAIGEVLLAALVSSPLVVMIERTRAAERRSAGS